MEYGYRPYFTSVTRPNGKNSETSSCIDNMYAKSNLNCLQSFKYIVPLPDHYPLFLNMFTEPERRN